MKKNRKMSKLIAMLLVLILVLCSCGSKTEEKTATDDSVNTSMAIASSSGETSSTGSIGSTSSTVESPAYSPEAFTSDVAIDSSLAIAGGLSDTTSDVFGATVEGEYGIEDFGILVEGGSSTKDSASSDDGYFEDYAERVDSDIEIEPIEPIEPIDPDVPATNYIQPGAHMLTAGEWDDNENYGFIKNLFKNGQDYDYTSLLSGWNINVAKRLVVACAAGSVPAENALVKVYSAEGKELWTGKTDNTGYCYCYYNLYNSEKAGRIEALYNGETKEYVIDQLMTDDVLVNISFDSAAANSKKLELMYVIDTTGSMGDEITFLQCELADVVSRVKEGNGDLPISLSVNFYRDEGDAYVVRSNPFSENISEQVSLVMNEFASGGGDWEEAVEKALDDAVNNHAWSEDATKILFLVLDAPPHKYSNVIQTLSVVIPQAAAKGIRIIPVAASGIDKETEFLLRSFAMVTGGTYTFLTNDSGIGGAHIEATVGPYEVEYLNDLMVRVIGEYLSTNDFVKVEDYGFVDESDIPEVNDVQ